MSESLNLYDIFDDDVEDSDSIISEYNYSNSDSNGQSKEPPSNQNNSTKVGDTNEINNAKQDNNSLNSNNVNKFLGRRRNYKNETNEIKIVKPRKYEKDNIFLKLQGHYITFIIELMNLILENLNYDKSDRFVDIDTTFKKNIKKSFFESLKTQNLYYILNNKASSKFTTKDENININLCAKLKNRDIIKKILNVNYLYLFINVYFKNNRILNLKKYGKDMIIPIPENIKMYNEIETSDELYKTTMNKYVEKYILPKKKFKVDK